MKKSFLYILLLVTLPILLFSCEEKVDYYHPEVEPFVNQLKAGTYNETNAAGVVAVPQFTKEDIPELLEYADDLTIIPSFPLPPVSSFVGTKVRLGECLLWIVESIRLGNAASLGCNMVRKEADNYEGIYFLTDNEVLDVVERYKFWWTHDTKYVKKDWVILPCYDDPLCGSSFRWW